MEQSGEEAVSAAEAARLGEEQVKLLRLARKAESARQARQRHKGAVVHLEAELLQLQSREAALQRHKDEGVAAATATLRGELEAALPAEQWKQLEGWLAEGAAAAAAAATAEAAAAAAPEVDADRPEMLLFALSGEAPPPPSQRRPSIERSPLLRGLSGPSPLMRGVGPLSGSQPRAAKAAAAGAGARQRKVAAGRATPPNPAPPSVESTPTQPPPCQAAGPPGFELPPTHHGALEGLAATAAMGAAAAAAIGAADGAGASPSSISPTSVMGATLGAAPANGKPCAPGGTPGPFPTPMEGVTSMEQCGGAATDPAAPPHKSKAQADDDLAQAALGLSIFRQSS